MPTAQNISNKISFYLLILLLIFLPFSSWLVSLSGLSFLALVRDFLVVLIALLALFSLRKDKITTSSFILGAIFILLALASFFWREASPLQWLRGCRYLVVPIVFFLALSLLDFGEKQKQTLTKTALVVSLPILILAILEFLGVKIPLTTSLSGPGALEQVHFVGTTTIARLQAVLAGPNALALYLLAILCFYLGNFKKMYILPAILSVAILVLTYSRSVLVGFIAILILILARYLWRKGQAKLFWPSFAILVVFAAAGIFFALKIPKVSQFITHDSSSSIRFDQYERVWKTKNEIGLLGRGTGTAGLASQNRLDGGPNHFTENTYLDVFEELGLVGLFVYLSLIISIAIRVIKRSKTAFLLLIGFAVSGFFINYYTGQVGLYLMWIAIALMPKENDVKNSD